MMMCASLASAATKTSKKKTNKTQTTTAVTTAPTPATTVVANDVMPSPMHRISGAAMLGTGANGFNAGFGVRGGYDLDQGFYAGGSFLYHLGNSSSYTSYTGTTYSSTARLWVLGAEGGYNYQAKPEILVRPYMGLGVCTSSVSSSPSAAYAPNGSNSRLGIWPGVSAAYTLQGNYFVGADVRYFIVSDNGALAAYANIGMHL